MTEVVEWWFREQQEACRQAFQKVGKAGRPGTLTKAVTINELLAELDRAVKQAQKDGTLREKLLPVLELAVEDSAAEATYLGMRFDVDNVYSSEWFREYDFRFASQPSETTSRTIRDVIHHADREGWSVPRMQRAITSTFATWMNEAPPHPDLDWMMERLPRHRTEMIARTEAMRASNAAKHTLAREAGVRQKEWVAAVDGREREAHRRADGQIVDVDKPFLVDGEKLMHPGDPAGSLGNTINCRCTIAYVIPEEPEVPEDEPGPMLEDLVAHPDDPEEVQIEPTPEPPEYTPTPRERCRDAVGQAVSMEDYMDIYDRAHQDANPNYPEGLGYAVALMTTAGRSRVLMPDIWDKLKPEGVGEDDWGIAGVKAGEYFRADPDRFWTVSQNPMVMLGLRDFANYGDEGVSRMDLEEGLPEAVNWSDTELHAFCSYLLALGEFQKSGLYLESETGKVKLHGALSFDTAEARDDYLLNKYAGGSDIPSWIVIEEDVSWKATGKHQLKVSISPEIEDVLFFGEKMEWSEAAGDFTYKTAAALPWRSYTTTILDTLDPRAVRPTFGDPGADHSVPLRMDREAFIAAERAVQAAFSYLEEGWGEIWEDHVQAFVPGAGREDEVNWKQSVQRSIAGRMTGNEAWEGVIELLRNPPDRGDAKAHADYELLEQTRKAGANYTPTATPEEQLIAGLIGCWASTSADAHPISLALQHAAAEEFGVEMPDFLDSRPAARRGRDWLDSSAAPIADGMKAFLRGMYENTQDTLRAAGLEDGIWLWRGMDSGMPIDNVDVLYSQDLRGGIADADLQPMSSFSSRWDISTRFAYGGTMWGAHIPMERIIGLPGTGYGCLNEREFVVLGGPGQLGVVNSSVPSQEWLGVVEKGLLDQEGL